VTIFAFLRGGDIKLTRFKDGRYCLSFYLDGKRRRETFSKLREPQLRSGEVERLKGRGVRVEIKKKVVADESSQYAIKHLIATRTTKPLTAVVDEYIAAHKALEGQGSIVEACKAYASNQDKIVPARPKASWLITSVT
jgi:hypothetical protein